MHCKTTLSLLRQNTFCPSIRRQWCFYSTASNIMRLSAKGTSNPTSKGRINARDRKRVRNSEKRQMRKFLSKTLFLDKAMPITKKTGKTIITKCQSIIQVYIHSSSPIPRNQKHKYSMKFLSSLKILCNSVSFTH